MRSEDRSLYYMPPPMRFILLLVITAIGLLLGSLLAIFLVACYLKVSFIQTQQALLNPENGHLTLFANAMASVISFLLPSVAISFFSNGSIAQNLGFKPIKSYTLVFWTIMLAMVGLLLSGSAANVTEKIPLPSGFKIWATALEETYKQAVLAMTKMNSYTDLLINIVGVALIPAIVEEIYFRATLQKTIKEWSGKPFVAIVITSILFSAFHFSFFGFLSRMVLGMVLGWLYEYTKTIWLPILMHFINNGFAIITLYLVSGNPQKINRAMDESLPIYWGILGIGLAYFIFSKIKVDAKYERMD